MSSLASASIGQSLTSFLDSVGRFFNDIAQLHWGVLVIGLGFFTLNLTARTRAFYNSLRAAYPAEHISWLRIWGAYWAAVGFNNVVPARGGDVIKLFLSKSSVRNSSYATVAAAFYVESVFDAIVGVFVLIYAFSQGVFPKPPAFAKLNAFDLSWLAANFRFTLFLLTLHLRGRTRPVRRALGARAGVLGDTCARASRSCATAAAGCARSSSIR